MHLEDLKWYSEHNLSSNSQLNEAVNSQMTDIEDFAEILRTPDSLGEDSLDNLRDCANGICRIYATMLYYDFKLYNLHNSKPTFSSALGNCLRNKENPYNIEKELSECMDLNKEFTTSIPRV